MFFLFEFSRREAMVGLVPKIMLLWCLADIVLQATGWYLTTTIRPTFPAWWRRVIVDETSFGKPL
jgi:hypothetical protein